MTGESGGKEGSNGRAKGLTSCCGRTFSLVVAFLRMGFENRIHNNEIGHAALVRIRTTARSRSPSMPAADHTGFRVIATHTASVKRVETAILMTLPWNEGAVLIG